MFVKTIIGRLGQGKTSLLVEQAEEYSQLYSVCLVQSVKRLAPRGKNIHLVWDFKSAVKWAWHHRPAVICVDEITVWLHGKDYKEDFHYILHFGRNVSIGLILNTQRPADVTADIRAITTQFFVFSLTEAGTDLDWVKKNLGESFVEPVRRLPKYHYILHPPPSEEEVIHDVSAEKKIIRKTAGRKEEADDDEEEDDE